MAEKLEIIGKISIDSKDANQSFQSLKSQLKEANSELQNVVEKFGLTSKEAQEAAKKVANLKDKIGDAKLLSDAFNPDAKFKALSNALSGVAGGFAAVQGAQALFGNESKELEKTLVKVQGALALSQGINSVLEAKDAFVVLGAKMSSIPIIQKAITLGQRLWNAAMAANPIGLLIAGITALIAAGAALVNWFMDSSAEAAKNTKAVEANTKAIADQSKTLDRNKEVFQKGLDQRLAMAKASGQNAEAIRKLELKLIDEKIAYAESSKAAALNTLEKQRNTLASLKSADADEEVIKKQEDNVKNATDLFNKQNDNLQKALDEKKDIQNRHEVEITQAETNARKDREQKIKEAEEKSKQAAKEKREKEKEEAKKKAKEDLENQKAEVQRAADRQIETEKLIQDARLAAIEEGFTKRQLLLEQEYQAEIDKALEQLNKKELTEAEYNARRLAIEQLFQTKRAVLVAENAKTEEEKDKEKRLKTINETLDLLNEEINNQESAFAARKAIIDKEDALLNDSNNRKLLGEAEYTKRIKALAEARKKIGEEEKKFKIAQQTEIANRLGQLSDLIGKQTAAGKALAIAQATINTYQGVTNVLAEKSTLPQPFGTISRIINIAATVAAGIKAIKEIVKVPVPGQGGGGNVPSATDLGGSAPISATPSTTALPQEQINQLSSANASVRSYVLESDIANNQERIVRLNRAARIN